MVLLFGIGLVNAAIYNGDVLTYYALFGLLMIPIGKLPNRWVWVIAALLFIQPLELWQYFSGHTLSIRGIEGMETLYPDPPGHLRRERPREPALRPARTVRSAGDAGTRTRHFADALLMFVLGMLAGRYRLSSTTKGSTDASGAGCWPWASRARGSYRSRRCAT